MAETLARITGWLRSADPRQIAFLNADCLNQADRRPFYAELLNEADLVLADGSGVRLAGALLGQRVRENVNGTDLFPRLCAVLEATGQGLYLLGGRPGVAQEVVAWIAAHHPGVHLAGWRDGFFSAPEEPAVARSIRQSGAALLLVALGAPKQDEWIRRNLVATGARVAIGVGGLFDFYSGRVSRAPGWMRELGLEWVYRFSREPGRMWKRYWIGNFVFVARVMRERLRGRNVRLPRKPEEGKA
jgi:N-acetylglucosaminyldiphosphoundecaprenol N-acetyl-beta-D-mannosaminyltransferase